MVLSLLTGWTVVFAGLSGFRLDPDSYTYASGVLGPYSFAGGLIGRIGGMPALIGVSAAAAAALVYLLPTQRARLFFLLAGGVWLLYPGVDALGVLMIALMLRAPLRGLWWLLAGIVHPVAALVSWPLLRPGRWTLWLVGASSIACIVAVGLIDTFSTTSRYLLPLIYLACLDRAAIPRVGSGAFSRGHAHPSTTPTVRPTLNDSSISRSPQPQSEAPAFVAPRLLSDHRTHPGDADSITG